MRLPRFRLPSGARCEASLLLDEPFEGVAPALAQRLLEVIAKLKKEGMSVLLSESDLEHSERMVDHLIVIDRGIVSARQSPL